VALSTAYGAATLTSMVVWSDEIAEQDLPEVSEATSLVSAGVSTVGGPADDDEKDSSDAGAVSAQGVG
jgi:hypothetical protein